MDLFTYLMAKNDHNTSVNRDLFSYLLGKGQSGTYQTFTGTSITANNTKKGKMKLKLTPTEMSQEGTPTPSSPIPVNVVSGDNTINVTGKNLLNNTSGITETISGVTFTKNDDGTITANGTATAGIVYYINGFNWQILPAGTYVLSDSVASGESSTTYFTYVDEESDSYLYLSTAAVTTRTYTSSPKLRARIVVRNGVTLNNVVFKPMIEVGSTATTYEPYTSTSYPIHLGEHWLGWIGDYKDRFFKNIPNTTDYKSDLEDNEWYLEKKIRHLSLAIADMNNNEDYPGWKNVPYIIEDLQGQGYIENLTSFKSNITDKRFSIAVTTYNSILYLDKTYGFGLTQTQWKTNYPNLVFELYYGLQTPTYTPITGTLKDELEAVWRANSYKGTTNISQVNNDLAFEIEAEIKVGN